MNRWKFNQ